MTKTITIHHYTRSAQWPAGEIQVFATITLSDGAHSATSTEDIRLNSPRLAKELSDLDEAILAEIGPEAKHSAPMGNDRLPPEVQDQVQLEAHLDAVKAAALAAK